MKRIIIALIAAVCLSAAAHATTPNVPNVGAVITYFGANCPEPTTTTDPTRSAPEFCVTDIQGGGKMVIGYQVNPPCCNPPTGDGVLTLGFEHVWTGSNFWSGNVTFAVGDGGGGWSHFSRYVGTDGRTYGVINVSHTSACSDQYQPFTVAPNDNSNLNIYFVLVTTNYGFWQLLENIPAGQPGAGTHQHFTLYAPGVPNC